MKYLFSIITLLFTVSFLFAQNRNNASIDQSEASPSATFAVIVGIANYENPSINLDYANRDAQVFAEYLQSKAGGSVPSENIRLLTDTLATTAAIYNALNWLRDKCDLNKIENEGKPALVYFYFSGHGDVETDTKANLGFLIAFNTPANNYLNNAIRIEDLNLYAHTMSVDLNAKVILITDACRSGKLAGSNNKGSFLVGKELSTAKEKEIRIASCLPDELSNEDERWGGGRGVFSWYLINGLKGLADRNKDNSVTLSEIKFYVDSSIAADPVLKTERLKQTPVVDGSLQFKLAEVNKEELLVTASSLVVNSAPLTDQAIFFSLLRNNDQLESIQFDKLKNLPASEIPFAFIKQVKNLEGTEIYYISIDQLERSIRADKEKLKLFNESLVELLHTHGQRVINLYLEGDAAELERRRYYSSRNSGYADYPAMYAVAMKLVEADNRLSHILRVNQYYFTGVATRLRLPFVNSNEQKILLEEAFAAQKKALALEDNAAYLHNETGILYYFKKQNDSAEKYYKNATMLAPDWAIPWANLCGLYADMKKKEESFAAGKMAESLQPGLQLAHSNMGKAYETAGNYLFAEEYYRKAIDINSRHFIPFERLGYVYMNTTQYALADSFFYEADLRKRGYNFQGNELFPVPLNWVEGPSFPLRCDVDTLVLEKDDIMAFFTWGVQEYSSGNYENARRILRKVIALDKTNPLVFHYMGKTFYDQQKWEDAEVMFKLALIHYRDYESFLEYCDSLIKGKSYRYPHECFEMFFRGKLYKKVEDDYFLGKLYDVWNHTEEAEYHYRKIIQATPDQIGGYIKLWQMMERMGRYTEAEKIIQSFAVTDKERTEKELNAFYRRAIDQFPENADWYNRLGLFLYEKAPLKSRAANFDTIIWFPKLNNEVFMDLDTYEKMGGDMSWDIMVKGSPSLVYKITIRELPQSVLLPGINEYIGLADPIYTPRKDAITYLIKADSLLAKTNLKADINFKIGNVFVWSGSKKQAFPYYAKSVELSPGNASARLNLVDMANALYKNRVGMEQLTYLYDHQQINFSKRMLYAEYCIHAAEFEKAEKLLIEARTIHPYDLPESYDLLGRLYFISRRPETSMKWYKDYVTKKPNDAFTYYTLAKLNLQTNNKIAAWKNLEAAMKYGFNYAYVLNTDDSWVSFRKDIKWKSLLLKYPLKKYDYPPVK